VDEREWTDVEDGRVTPYAKSKTLAERAARDFMAQHHAATSFVTVNPALVLGPVMSKDFSGSVQVVSRLLKGQVPGIPRIGFNIVDVRDVADLHFAAMTTPAAADGRYIAAGRFMWFEEIAQVLRDRMGPRASKVSTRRLPDWVVRLVALADPGVKSVSGGLSRRRDFSSAKAEADFGWRTRPAEETILDTGDSLYTHGAV
jgi:dihydroflavonol-4-reductase